MYNSIKGNGAFRIFKDKIYRHKIENEWYKFKDNALNEIAIDWCKSNKIKYE